MNIGEKIRKIRELKNMKQQAIAKKLGMSLTAYGNIERNESSVTYEKLEQIACMLDVSVQDILNIPEEMNIRQLIHATLPIPGAVPASTTDTEVEVYKLCIEQYKKENDFLREMIKQLTGKTGV
jgi:transcriptional regulator with XRE-family HTH domain